LRSTHLFHGIDFSLHDFASLSASYKDIVKKLGEKRKESLLWFAHAMPG